MIWDRVSIISIGRPGWSLLVAEATTWEASEAGISVGGDEGHGEEYRAMCPALPCSGIPELK